MNRTFASPFCVALIVGGQGGWWHGPDSAHCLSSRRFSVKLENPHDDWPCETAPHVRGHLSCSFPHEQIHLQAHATTTYLERFVRTLSLIGSVIPGTAIAHNLRPRALHLNSSRTRPRSSSCRHLSGQPRSHLSSIYRYADMPTRLRGPSPSAVEPSPSSQQCHKMPDQVVPPTEYRFFHFCHFFPCRSRSSGGPGQWRRPDTR
jgi:hypothetical protein